MHSQLEETDNDKNYTHTKEPITSGMDITGFQVLTGKQINKTKSSSLAKSQTPLRIFTSRTSLETFTSRTSLEISQRKEYMHRGGKQRVGK